MLLDFTNIPDTSFYITKDDILSKVSEEDIIEYYTNAPVKFNKPYLSPIRAESNPSFTLMKTNHGKIMWKDWGINLRGNCFDLVMHKYNCGYREALNIIYTDLIKSDETVKSELKYRSIKRSYVYTDPDKRTLISVEEQPYSIYDHRYWGKYGIDLETLYYYNVFSVKNVYINKIDPETGNYRGFTHVAQYRRFNPVYAYKFKEFKYISYKIYRPFEHKRYKFLFNGRVSDVEGYDQLPWLGDLLIITKALKDVMVLYKMGYNAISLQGETNPIPDNVLSSITHRFAKIIVLYDNDKPGIKAANKLKIKHNLDVIFVKGAKDISDYVEMYGMNSGEDLMKELIDECN